MSYPVGWHETRLDQWGQLVSGATPSTAIPEFWEGDIVWVTPLDLSRLSTPYLSDSSKRITISGLNSCSAQLVPAGNIVVSSRAPIGYIALPTVPFCTNQGCKTIKLYPGVAPLFAYYNILFHVDRIKKLGEGTTFAEISKSRLATVTLPLPSAREEQTKIAEVLSAVDGALQKTEALIVKQDRVQTGFMQDLLTRGIDEYGVIRSENTHSFKDSPLGRIPDEWSVETFEQITPVDAPIGYGIVQPGAFDEYGVPVAGIYTINSQFQRWHMSSVRIEGAYSRSRIRAGDVLLSIKGTTGRAGVVPQGMEGNISREIARIRPTERVNPYFLRFLILSDVFQRYLVNAEVGTTRAEISIKILRQLSVLVPPRSEQDRIVTNLESGQRHLTVYQDYLVKLRAIKTGLMQDLLTARVRVIPMPEQVPKKVS